MRIKVSSQAQSKAAGKIKEQRVKTEIAEASRDKRVIPVSFLTIYKWQDGYEVRGRDKNSQVQYEAVNLDDAINFVKDNL